MLPRIFSLRLLEGELAVCRLDPGEPIPAWAHAGVVTSITRTPSELSIVCDAGGVPAGVRAEGPWRAFEVAGPFGFDELGVMASLAGSLAEAGVSLLAISTFDTDYLLVAAASVEAARRAFAAAGHAV